MKKFMSMSLIFALLIGCFAYNTCSAIMFYNEENENEGQTNVEDYPTSNRYDIYSRYGYQDDSVILTNDNDGGMAPDMPALNVSRDDDQSRYIFQYSCQSNQNDDECFDIFNRVPDHLFSQYKRDDEDNIIF